MIDIWGVISDTTVGAIFGLGIGLTLHKGGVKRTLGFVFTSLLVACAAGEAGWLLRVAAHGEAPTSNDGSRNNRRLDETRPQRDLTESDKKPVASPTPRASTPDADPPEVKAKRDKAHALLDKIGPLPGPAADQDVRAEASALAKELEDFDNHYAPPKDSGKDALTHLDLEIAQLHLVAHELSSADNSASMAKASLSKEKKGTPGGRRLAIALGTQGIIALEQGDAAAKSDFDYAKNLDATIPELHFYVGKLEKNAERRSAELKLFLSLAGPAPPPSQAELVAEAKQLLGD